MLKNNPLDYRQKYHQKTAQFSWLIISQYLLIFALYLFFNTNMLFTSASLLVTFGYFFSVLVNQVTASNKVFLALLTGFVFALTQDMGMSFTLAAKLAFLLPLAVHFHAKLAKRMNN